MAMDAGDEYVQRLAAFIRANEAKLALSPFLHRPISRLPFHSSKSPVILSVDHHLLCYLLLRLEGLGLPVGPLDVRLDPPTHLTKYPNISSRPDHSEVLSLASFRSSITAMTFSSLPTYWWTKPSPSTVDFDLKYIYSCFTKLPALLIKTPGPNSVSQWHHSPDANALPLDVFKNLQSLECEDIDPRTLLDWGRLAGNLKSLKIRRSGINDFSDVFITSVLNTDTRRSRSASPHCLDSEPIPTSCGDPQVGCSAHPSGPARNPPPLNWTFLRYLSLRDNAITFFPTNILCCFISLTHLDLASNLLVSIPSGLDALDNLIFLDLSDNMIDTVLGIYMELRQIQTLDLSRNRLESICGLERLRTLVRVDLRHNFIQEVAEIGRLSTLAKILEVRVDGNPFVEYEEDFRQKCFDMFWSDGKMIRLDGTMPSFFERRGLSIRHMPASSVAPPTMGRPDGFASSSNIASNSDAFSASLTKHDRHFSSRDLQRTQRKFKRVVELDQPPQTKHADMPVDHLAMSVSMPFFTDEQKVPHQHLRHGRYHTEILSRSTEAASVSCRDDLFLAGRGGCFEVAGRAEGRDLRRRIDTLKRDVGDGWLKVFSGRV